MRHAKSAWDNTSLKDFDRPLNPRGKRDAPDMGRYLDKINLRPDHIISSPAQRARQTVLLLADTMNFDKKTIIWNEDLYFQGMEYYMESIQNSPEMSAVVLIAGHNPTIEQLVLHLSKNKVRDAITTANIACFEADTEHWREVVPGVCRFKWLKRPKDVG